MKKIYPLVLFLFVGARLSAITMEFESRWGEHYARAVVSQRDMWASLEWNVVWHQVGKTEATNGWRRPNAAMPISFEHVNRLLNLLCIPTVRAQSNKIRDSVVPSKGILTARIIRREGAVETVYLDANHADVITEIESIIRANELTDTEKNEPNNAVEPTPVDVTIPAAQEVAPSTSAAHLGR